MGGDLESHEVGATQALGDPMTMRETMVDVVARRADHTFLVDAVTHREITYGEFHKQACALAAELRRQGNSERRPRRRDGSQLLRTGGSLFRLHLSWGCDRSHQPGTQQQRGPIHLVELQACADGGRPIVWRCREGNSPQCGQFAPTRREVGAEDSREHRN